MGTMTSRNMPTFDWKAEIAKLVYVKQALAEVDINKLWPWHLPNPPATAEDIQACEKHVGFALDPMYAAFLRHADGWQGFYHAADLFGTRDLVGGANSKRAQEGLSYIEQNVL